MREVVRGDKPYLRKSTGRKAQIRKAFVQFSGLICALRSVDFLREGLSPRATSRTISFSISNIVFGINKLCKTANSSSLEHHAVEGRTRHQAPWRMSNASSIRLLETQSRGPLAPPTSHRLSDWPHTAARLNESVASK